MTALRRNGIDIRGVLKRLPMPTIIIGAFWIFILVLGTAQGMSLPTLIKDAIKRFGMWGLLVLAMVPSIQSGTGPNFALPIGVVCGLIAIVFSIEFGLTGLSWLLVSIVLAIIIAAVVGFVYGILMNAVKGSEMTIATYTGFSITFLAGILWLNFPFKSPIMGWMMGTGLRNTVELDQLGGGEIINRFLSFEIFGVAIPTGMLLLVFFCCFIVWLFFRTKTGVAISAAGMNPKYARASGLNVDRGRIVANIFSTIFAAVGIIVYSQSYGYASLYDAPLMMAFQAVAAVLIGGATARRARIANVLIGTMIFQGLLANTPSVLGKAFPGTNLTEIMRMIVQNGIILYALTQVKGGDEA